MHQVFSSIHADTFVKGKLRCFHTKSKWNQAFIIVFPLNNEMAFLFIGSSTIDVRFRNIRLFQVYSVVRAAIFTKMYWLNLAIMNSLKWICSCQQNYRLWIAILSFDFHLTFGLSFKRWTFYLSLFVWKNKFAHCKWNKETTCIYR